MANFSSEKEEKDPFYSIFFGDIKLVNVKNSSQYIVDISLDFQKIIDLLEDDDTREQIIKYCAHKDKEGTNFLHLKGVPLRTPKDWKTHFIKIDYFKKKQND